MVGRRGGVFVDGSVVVGGSRRGGEKLRKSLGDGKSG